MYVPALQLIYDTAPIGLAFLSCDCRYLQINQRLTEICGISVTDHIGRSVRDTVPAVADQVETIVQTILRTGEPVIGVEVNGQRPDGSNAHRFWITYWHPLKNNDGSIAGINVAAEEITGRKRAQADLVASEMRFRELAAGRAKATSGGVDIIGLSFATARPVVSAAGHPAARRPEGFAGGRAALS
jgi:PAS domain S-box-containing protein